MLLTFVVALGHVCYIATGQGIQLFLSVTNGRTAPISFQPEFWHNTAKILATCARTHVERSVPVLGSNGSGCVLVM